MEIKGRILEIGETQEVKDNFRKREFVLEYSENDKYTEYIKFETIQERCEILDPFNPGNEVEVSFNLRGRPWVDKNGKKNYFNSLQAWRLKPLSDAPPAVDASSRGSAQPPKYGDTQQAKESPFFKSSGQSDDDDLPF